jgi:hypothetical protein
MQSLATNIGAIILGIYGIGVEILKQQAHSDVYILSFIGRMKFGEASGNKTPDRAMAS